MHCSFKKVSPGRLSFCFLAECSLYIKLVISEEESPYTEGILFHNGFELAHTEPDCTYDGEWNFEHNGIEYIVLVEAEFSKVN